MLSQKSLEVPVKTARVRADRPLLLARFAVLGALALVPGLVACSSGAEGGGGSSGSGGSSNGSGGSTSSGGNSGSGGSSSSGGAVGSGGNTGSGGSTSGSGGSTSGSGGSASGSGGSSGAPCDAPTMLFNDTVHGCLDGGGANGCHTSTQNPILTGSNIIANLKNKKALILCGGESYVNPANPESSVLYKVVAGTSCSDTQMPQPPREAPVTQQQLDCLKDWISKIQ